MSAASEMTQCHPLRSRHGARDTVPSLSVAPSVIHLTPPSIVYSALCPQPLTYLKPTVRTEEVEAGEATFTVVEVLPRL